MARVLLDTNIYIAVSCVNHPEHGWATCMLDALNYRGDSFHHNALIFGEVATGFETLEDVSELFRLVDSTPLALTRQVMFDASSVYRQYRLAGGKREKLLADFVIGATAVHYDTALLTLNAKDFKRFPTLELLSPRR